MSTIITYAQAQAALQPYYGSHRPGPYSLDHMRLLMAYLGNPQEKLRTIHVAGTSGKTSTAYYVAALLRASGHTVGLSVSPHVDVLAERAQINGSPLSEVEFCAVLSEFLEVIKSAPVKPTYFELMVALALWEFARREVDYAVIEVGMGGLLDGTNVIEREDKICIITDIGMDHTEVLGDTLGKIAAQKAGIIQDRNEVFMYRQSEEVMAAVAMAVHIHDAGLYELSDSDAISDATLPLFQQRNLGLAVRAVSFVLERDYGKKLSKESIVQATTVQVPARLERFTFAGKTVIVDGSHNQQKLRALMQSIQALYPGQEIAVLAGFVKGSDTRWQEGLKELMPIVKHVIFTTFHGVQDLPKLSVDSNTVAAYCQQQAYTNFEIENDPVAAFKKLQARPEPVLLVTGSFYLLNHIRPLLKNR